MDIKFKIRKSDGNISLQNPKAKLGWDGDIYTGKTYIAKLDNGNEIDPRPMFRATAISWSGDKSALEKLFETKSHHYHPHQFGVGKILFINLD